MGANSGSALSIGSLIFIFGCSWAASAIGQEIKGLPNPKSRCVGELEKQHPRTPYEFTTNSQKPIDGFTFQHCVRNNNSSNSGVVDIRWLIPELNLPIPGNESRLSPRYSEKPTIGNKDGCLIYGNLLDKDLKAEFWAREADQESLDREKGIGNCLAAFKTPPSAGKKSRSDRVDLRDIHAPFRVFLTADLNSPEKSLVAFEGVTGVRMRSARSYQSFLQYRVRRVEGSDARVLDGYTISPRWIGDVENLARFYNTGDNRPAMAIVSSGEPVEIRFEVQGAEGWTFAELEYQLRARDRVVTSVYAPAFIPAR